jgi:hypothetical protein
VWENPTEGLRNWNDYIESQAAKEPNSPMGVVPCVVLQGTKWESGSHCARRVE